MSRSQKCIEVINAYSAYTALKAREKLMQKGDFCLKRSSSNANFLTAKKLSVDKQVAVEIKQRAETERHYSINLFCHSFMGTRPSFRFDADGHVHTNRNDLPLSERRIPTPHFHEFDNKGREIAYRTAVINNDAQFPRDRVEAIKHFSEVHNVCFDGDFKVLSESSLFQDASQCDDPNFGEEFDE